MGTVCKEHLSWKVDKELETINKVSVWLARDGTCEHPDCDSDAEYVVVRG
jgi:hypothetical protein